MKVLVVYWTGSGNTGMIADAVKEGLEASGASVDIRMVSDITPSEASAYDKIALGCPSMGVEQLEEFEFEPFYGALKDSLAGKKVALFGAYGWGDCEWMRNWEEDVRTSGATLVDDGLTINETPDDAGLEAARKLGAILAKA